MLDGLGLCSLFSLKYLTIIPHRDQIGVVGQEPVLFGCSIAENIRLGFPEATREEIEEAAIAANAHHFIIHLPNQYNTLVGERGSQLSGGQKQRIAIARALVRKPKILLFDEATSALDLQSESIVQSALEKASVGRTTFIVAHRLSTIRAANKIIVIKKGRVEEVGTHNQLMVKKGLYFQLIEAQQTGDDEMNENEIDENNGRLEYVDLTQNDSEFELNIEEENNALIPVIIGKVKKQSVSMSRLLGLLTQEKVFVIIGCLSSFLMGLNVPAYGILFGEIVGTLAKDKDQIRESITFYCIAFIVLGILTGLVTFLKVNEHSLYIYSKS
jgi:ABC-type methionine transport system ATPase subunit